MIGRSPDGDWYNAERRICRSASSSYGSGVEVVAPKSKEFRAILEASPVVDSSLECRWKREECYGMMWLEFEDLLL